MIEFWIPGAGCWHLDLEIQQFGGAIVGMQPPGCQSGLGLRSEG